MSFFIQFSSKFLRQFVKKVDWHKTSSRQFWCQGWNHGAEDIGSAVWVEPCYTSPAPNPHAFQIWAFKISDFQNNIIQTISWTVKTAPVHGAQNCLNN